MTMADALAPHSVARVLLLSVVRPGGDDDREELPQRLADAQSVLGGSLSTALDLDLRPEALVTISRDPWDEIVRVSERYRCASVVLGVGSLGESLMTGPLEDLLGRVSGDVVILRAPPEWKVDQARKIFVPSGGRRDQSPIRARLIGNLSRTAERKVSYLRVLDTKTGPETVRRVRRELERMARDEAPGVSTTEIVLSDSIVDEAVDRASTSDLLILGLQRLGPRKKVFGDTVLEIARKTFCPLLMISRRR
jgi:nucleotide-binding universal stress UspA family protein